MNKILIPIAFALVILIGVTAITMAFTFYLINEMRDENNHLYVMDIDRSSDEENGLEMIDQAEGYDYSSILNVTPIDDSPIMMLKPIGERANFVSQENIDHFSNIVQTHEKNKTFGQYKFEYTATALDVGDVELRLRSRRDTDRRSSGLYYYGRHIGFSFGLMRNLAFFNGSSIISVDPDSPYYWEESFGIFYHDCTFVEMKIDFSSHTAPDEGGGFELYQYVVIDPLGKLMFVFSLRIDFGQLPDFMDAPW